MAQIDLKQATVYLVGGGTGEEIEITLGEGNMTYSEKRPITYTKDRGMLDEVKLGDQEPIDVSLSFTWEYVSASVSLSTAAAESGTGRAITPIDVLKNTIGWTSSDSDTCRPFAVDVKIVYQPDCTGQGSYSKETIILPDFRYEQLDYDLSAGTISVTGKCNAIDALTAREYVT